MRFFHDLPQQFFLFSKLVLLHLATLHSTCWYGLQIYFLFIIKINRAYQRCDANVQVLKLVISNKYIKMSVIQKCSRVSY